MHEAPYKMGFYIYVRTIFASYKFQIQNKIHAPESEHNMIAREVLVVELWKA